MSDALRYAVWPDPRSRSRSLKGSRPSVPHGTNFYYHYYYKIIHKVQLIQKNPNAQRKAKNKTTNSLNTLISVFKCCAYLFDWRVKKTWAALFSCITFINSRPTTGNILVFSSWLFHSSWSTNCAACSGAATICPIAPAPCKWWLEQLSRAFSWDVIIH